VKNHHLDLVRVTEAGAIAASDWVGRGQKELADKDATDSMRARLDNIDFSAVIAIGEGEKDKSYGLFEGEKLGLLSEEPLQYDIAIDPIEGTTPTAKGGYEAISVIAMANANSFYKAKGWYMDKIAVGPEVVAAEAEIGRPGLDNIPEMNVRLVAKLGCRIKFIGDCDVTACIATCMPDSGIDMYWSIGGSPEAVIAAAAMKCMGGFLQCRDVDENFVPVDQNMLLIGDLVKGDCIFSATGITDGQLLRGVRYSSTGPITNSIAMRSGSGTIRQITTNHGN
jgi:fructose-1,6-bisphosphatase/sedoheptulose 1,7-bisphosphatase-like protein